MPVRSMFPSSDGSRFLSADAVEATRASDVNISIGPFMHDPQCNLLDLYHAQTCSPTPMSIRLMEAG
ncbi:hypothetical protein SAY87_019771 [Trapa incisa]|uniref:Uncharacterized protein n=1 Tax=Trapa incisa TaxID=236973 RepID=A0AAN7K8F3_9MYRT|nr:hypothetical protein SAY87_019771 [Trapa incisa]